MQQSTRQPRSEDESEVAHACRRVCEVKLFGQNKFEIKQQKYRISDELKQGQARVLFGELWAGLWLSAGVAYPPAFRSVQLR